MSLDDSVRQLVREEMNALLEQWMPRVASQAARRPPRPARDQDDDTQKDWLSFATVAERVDRKVRTVRRWIAEGKLKTCGPDGHHVSRFDLDRFMSQGPAPVDDDDDQVERVIAKIVKK
jgi:hypothetical protein